MSTPKTNAPRFAAGRAVVPSPQPRSRTLRPGLMPSWATRASPLSRMVSAMRVKLPFSQRAWLGLVGMVVVFMVFFRLNAPAWRARVIFPGEGEINGGLEWRLVRGLGIARHALFPPCAPESRIEIRGPVRRGEHQPEEKGGEQRGPKKPGDNQTKA